PWLNALQESGYVFYLVYLSLPAVELALARISERVRRGGHTVPEAVVRRRYERGLTNFFEIYSPFADVWFMLDNAAGVVPRLVAYRAGRTRPKVDPGLEKDDELLGERIAEQAGKAIREAIRDHKRAGNSIAQWKDGRVVLIPPDQIED